MARTRRDHSEALTCAHCMQPITAGYVQAMAVVSGTRASGPNRVLDIPGGIALCPKCTSTGIAFSVAIQWQEVEE